MAGHFFVVTVVCDTDTLLYTAVSVKMHAIGFYPGLVPMLFVIFA